MWVMCFINKANESTCMLDFGSQYGYLCLDWCLSTLRLPLHVSFYHSIDLARFYFLFFALVSSSVYRRSFSVSLLFISISVSENVMCASQKRLLPAYLHSFAHAHEILTKSETVLLRLVHCSLLIAHWLRTFNTRCSQSPYIWGKHWITAFISMAKPFKRYTENTLFPLRFICWKAFAISKLNYSKILSSTWSLPFIWLFFSLLFLSLRHFFSVSLFSIIVSIRFAPTRWSGVIRSFNALRKSYGNVLVCLCVRSSFNTYSNVYPIM